MLHTIVKHTTFNYLLISCFQYLNLENQYLNLTLSCKLELLLGYVWHNHILTFVAPVCFAVAMFW